MTTRVTIGVKHGKETHDVDVDLDESGATFKARLFSLTNVPIERIKVTGLKGCLLYTSPSPRDGLLSRMPSSA